MGKIKVTESKMVTLRGVSETETQTFTIASATL